MKKKNKVFATVLTIVMATGLISGCSGGNIENNEILNVKNLEFEFDVDPETFEIKVKSNGKEETLSEPLEKRKIENLTESKDKISWTYPEEKIEVIIKKENDYLDVDIKSNKEEESNFTWPRVKGENYILPLHEGKFIPSEDQYWKEFLDEQSYNLMESFSMQFFAVEKENYALTYIIKNKFNNEIKFDGKEKISFEFNHEYPSINKNKEYGFRIYLNDKDVVEIAKTYKNYIVENGEFKTLKEKAKENKDIEKLYGASHIYFWDMSIIAESDIKWGVLKNYIEADFQEWIEELLKIKVEDGEELAKVFNDIKNQDYIDKYQKSQIVNAFNTLMKLKEFYNSSIFKEFNDEIKELIEKGTENLNKIELVKLNKLLLKSKLKDGTIDSKEWGKANTIEVLEEMKKSGIDNAWIGFDDIEAGHVSPEFVETAKDYGYLIAPYDSYHSIHKPGEEQWSTATFKDKTLYENATIENKKGEKLTGFNKVGRKLNPTLSLESVKDRVGSIIDTGYGFNSWFIDCDGTGEVYDDYSKEHITTQEEDLKARIERMEYIKNKENMIIGSEGGNDFVSKTIAFAHGLETPAFSWVDPDMNSNKDSEYYVGRYYSATGGVPEVFSKQVPVKELYKKVFLDQKYSLPLFRLVYNDSVITSYQWLWGTFKVKDEVENRMMQEVLYNTAPMYHIDKTEWNKYKDDIGKHNKVWSEFNKKAIKEEMTGFKVLSEDRLVQMSKYGDDLAVIANFSNNDFSYEGEVIEKNSLVIYDKNEKQVYRP
ncbi:MAG: glycoside hydrolase [Sarcina sp.]